MLPPRPALPLALALSLIACQDPSTDEGDTGTDTDDGPSHAADIQPIWDANCVTYCHEPGGLGAPLDLTDAYDVIVGAPSTQAAADLVAPGSPADSYLLAKLRDTQADLGGQGIRMPAGGAAPLDDATIELVSTWIAAGAPP